MNRKHRFCTLDLSYEAPKPPRVMPQSNATKKRLAEAVALLESLRNQVPNSPAQVLSKTIEDRIVWRELLDLELQELDEQIERISASMAEAPD